MSCAGCAHRSCKLLDLGPRGIHDQNVHRVWLGVSANSSWWGCYDNHRGDYHRGEVDGKSKKMHDDQQLVSTSSQLGRNGAIASEIQHNEVKDKGER
jgi:hypothetical protein